MIVFERMWFVALHSSGDTDAQRDDAPVSSTLPASRRQAILDRVREDGEAQVSALAAELGVAPITVRRDITALAEDDLVEQVHGGAKRIDSGPEPASQGSRTAGEHPTIAMVVPSLRYYWPAIVQGATAAAQRCGADLEVHASTANAEANLLVVEQVTRNEGIDALIIAPELRAGPATDRLIERLACLPIPVILAERGIDGHGVLERDFDTVRSDHSLGAAMAIRHLAALGHRRIAYEGDPYSPTHPFVESGYERAVDLLGLRESAVPTGVLDPNGDRPFAELDAALERYATSGTTGVLIHSDVAATMLVQHATRSGLSIPGDLSLIAYDDELSVATKPALSAVSPAKRELGARTVELALHRMEAPDAPIEHVMLLPSLQARDSTAAPP